MPIIGRGSGGGGGGGTVDAVARALINPVVGTPAETIAPGNQAFSNGKLWQNTTTGPLTIPATITVANMAAAGFTPVSAVQAGELTRFVAAKPANTVGTDNDQVMITSGVRESMILERAAGTWTYVGQFNSPKRTTVYPLADRNTIGTEISVIPGSNFWYVLLQRDGTNEPGWYSIDDQGIQSGPFVGANPATANAKELTDFVAVKPLAAAGSNGDQVVVTSGILETMVFEKTGGVWNYACQAGSPKRTTVFPLADRNAVAAELVTRPGSNFWYVLLQQDGTNAPGWYSIDDQGIQSGPFVGASPATTTAKEFTDFVAVKPLAAAGSNGDQVVVTSGILESMVFEKTGGAWNFVCQAGAPSRTSIYSVADRNAVAAELVAKPGSIFSYMLMADDGTNLKGWYFIDETGMQVGPV
jgi:hypothetical protein